MSSVLIKLTLEALYIVLIVSLPVLIASLVTGLIVGIFQTITQLQEHTLSFVPKIIVVFLVLALLSHWIGNHIVKFTFNLWSIIPKVTI